MPKDVNTLADTEATQVTNKTVTLQPNEVNTLSFGQADLTSPPTLDTEGNLVFHLSSGETFTIQNFREFAESNASCGPDSLIQLSDATIIYPQQLMAELSGKELGLIAPSAGVDGAASAVTLLSMPTSGETQIVAIERGQDYKFGFDLSEGKVEQRGEDLVVNFDNGGVLVMQNYFANATCDTPAVLSLNDGVVVDPQNIMAIQGFDTAEAADNAPPEAELAANVEPAAGEEKIAAEKAPADIEPAAGQEQQLAQMAEAAQELAEIEPAAGPTAAGGGRGYGFQSAIDTVLLNGVADIGPIGATALNYVAPAPTPGEFVFIAAPAAGPTLTPPLVDIADQLQTLEDNNIGLPIIISNPGAGNTVTITITGIPAGWTLTGAGNFNPTTGTWTLTLPTGQGYNGIGPRFLPPPNSDVDALNLPYTVVTSNGSQSVTASGQIDIIVDAVADPPTLNVPDNNGGVSGNPLALTITTAVTDTDGSETISKVVVRNLPAGFTLSAGTFDAVEGTWTLTTAQLVGLQVIPPATFSGTINFFVESHSHDTPTDVDFNNTNNDTFVVDRVSFSWIRPDTTPIVDNDTKTIDETSAAPVSVSGTVPANFQTDGPGSVTGNNTFAATGSVTAGGLKSGGDLVTVSWNAATRTYTGMAGGSNVFTLVVNADGTYTYTQFATLDHADASNANDVITLTFGVVGTDADGDTDTGNIIINVRDDAPVAANDTIATNGGTGATGNVLTNDNLSNDVANTVTSILYNGTTYTVPATGTVTIAGVHGTLVIGANGAYTYTSNNTTTGNDVFTYTVRDLDGDTSTANLTATVGDIDSVPVIGNDAKTIDETDAAPITVTGTVPADYVVDGPGTIAGNNVFTATGSVTTGGLKAGGVAVVVTYDATTKTYTGKAGTVTVFTLTVNANGTYSFTLNKPLDHADGTNANDVIALNFGVIGTDADGDTDTGTITINVRDDAPVAANDTITSNGPAATGNVLTNDNLSNDVTNIVTKIVFNGTTYTVPATGNLTVQGVYGTLVINKSGAYTYTSKNTGVGNDVFTYTVQDSDGDTSTANLTANVGDLDTVPVIGDSVKTLDETTLDADGISVSGTVPADFRADAPGTIRGNNVFAATGSVTTGGLKSGGVAVVVTYDATTGTYTGKAGTVTVFTLVISANGNYTFTQFKTLDHADGTNPNDSIALNFGVIGQDSDNDTDTGTITINIVDDAPSAANDTITSNGAAATGNVLTNDNLSNDGTNVVTKIVFNGTTYTVPGTGTLTVQGTYGTLVIRANGNYTYTSKNTGTGADVFTYTVQDSDGDTATATLTGTVGDIDTVPVIGDSAKTIDETDAAPITTTGTVSVDFKADAPGTVAGNNVFTATGSVTAGGLKSNGVAVVVTYDATTKTYTGKAGTVTVFTLVIGNNGSYTFTLNDTLDHADGTNPNDSIALNFGVIGTDSDGDTDTGTITINVVDDAPVAANDTLTTGTTATGNVLTNDNLSNDGTNVVTKVVFNGTTFTVPATGTVSIVGTYGTLVIRANGSYTYTSKNSGTGTDTFTYTVQDSDGDTSTANLNATINDVDTVPVIGNDTKTIDETDAAPITVTGTVPADFGADGPGTVAGNNVFTATGSVTTGGLKSGGVAVVVTYDATTKTYTGKAGTVTVFTLTVNANGTYSFTLNKPLDHADGTNANDVIALNFGVIGQDSDNDTDTGTITINVRDDAPVAANDTITSNGQAATGNVLTNDNLSNDVANTVTKIVFNGTTYNVPASGNLTIQGVYGTLVINKSGAYTYTSKNSGVGTDTFTYTVVDSDGDSSTANLAASVGDVDTVPVIGDSVKTIDETTMTGSGLTVTGTVPADFRADAPGTIVGNNTFTATGSVTTGGLKSNGVAVVVTYDATTKTYTGKAGTASVFTLVINADGSYTFRLLDTIDHANGADPNDVIALNFGVIGSDADGDTDTGTITINVVDDAPSAANDTVTSNGPAATGNVLTNDDLSNDGTNVVTKIVFNGTTYNVPASGNLTIQGVYGTLVINKSGAYTYTSKNTGTGTDTFTYTVQDGDGDTATANLSASVGDVDTIPVIGNDAKTIDETNAQPITVTGTVPANFGADGPGTVAGNNTFTSTGSVTTGGLKSGGVAVVVTYDATTKTYTGKAGTVTVFTLTVNANGTYSFTLNKPLDHADGSNPNDSIALNFGVTGTDADGDTDTGTITINVVDDAPVAANDTITSNGPAATGNVLTNDNLSNDGTNIVTKIVFNGTTYNVPGTGTLTVQGVYGTLVISKTGAYTYTSKNTGTGTDTFTYTVVDSDGDSSTANLAASVGDIDTVPVIGNDTKAIDETSNAPVSVTGSVSVDFKADGPGTVAGNNTFTATGSTSGGLKSNGVAVVVTYDATTKTYTGKAGAVTVFTLVINNNGSYTFTLNDTLDHADATNPNDVISLNFGVIGTDADGDTDTGTITINVADDAPVAANDTITSNGPAATGNVLTNDNLSNDGTNIVTKIVFNGTTYNVPASGNLTIQGVYGTLVINKSGAYTYTSKNSGVGTDTFTYTVVDSDGDASTANLSASVGDVDTVPVIGNDTKSIDETNAQPNVVTGTVSTDFGSDGPGTVAGNNTFTATGSVTTGGLKANGVAVVVTYDTATRTYTGKAGALTVFTLVVNTNGSYTFTLNEALDHANASSPNDVIALNFGVIGTDSDGDTDTGTITINIVDDAPVAANDTATVNGNNGALTASGNVQSNDDLSNDTPNVITQVVVNGTTYNVPGTGTVSIAGQFGTLVIGANGAYTYTSSNTAVGTDVFTYTLRDSDGDSSTANLSVTVADIDTVPVIGNDAKTIDETNAQPNVVTGQVSTDWRADGVGTVVGNNTFTATGSVTSGGLKSNGVAVVVTYDASTKTYTGKAGGVTVFTLVINANGSYTFTLNDTLDHADGSNPNDSIALNFGVIGTDTDNDSDTGTITINIVDDAPVAANDAITSNGPGATGNVLSNDNLSNDGTNVVTKIVFNGTTYNVPGTGTLTVQGTYGTLVIGANGAYTYTSKNTGTGNDVFTYTVQDSDGDTSTANLTATVGDVDTVPVIGNDSKSVDETNAQPNVVTGQVSVDWRSDGPGTVTGNNTFNAMGSTSGGLKSNGVAVAVTYDASTKTYTGKAGGITVFTLVINANGSYTFTLNETLDHADGSNANDIITLSFGIIGTDTDGDTDTGTISIQVVDDAPVAVNDTASINNGSLSVTGNVLSNDDLSNDGTNVVTQIVFNGTTYTVPGTGALSLTGTYGILTISANGSYTYTSKNTAVGTDSFTYRVVDYDGDSSTANLNLTVADIDTIPVIGDSVRTTDETTLGPNVLSGQVPVDFGSDTPGTVVGNNTFSATGSLSGGALKAGGVGIAVTYDASTRTYTGKAGGTTVFTLVVNTNGSYTFSLFQAIDHAQPADPNDVISLNFGVIGTDSDGDVDTGTITINIVDDAPTAANDTATLSGNSITGNVLSNDQVGNDSTSHPITKVVFNGTTYNVPATGTISITGTYGTLVIGSNGAYSYTRAGSNGGTDVFTYTVQDGDGDTATASLSLTAPMIDTVPDIGDVVRTIDESNLGPTVVVSGTVPADFKANAPGTIFATGVGTFSAGGSMLNNQLSHLGTAINVTLEGNTYVGRAGGSTAFTLLVNADGTYTFTQYLTLDHADCPNPDDVITLRFGVTGRDADGDTDTGTITINVADDAPVPVNDGFSLNGASSIGGNVLTNDNISHEPNTAWLVKTVAFGGNSFVLPQNGAQLTIVGMNGTLRINKDGSFSYTKIPGRTGTDVFTYTVWDYEGDFASATLTINAGNGPATFSSSITSHDDSASAIAPLSADSTFEDNSSATALSADWQDSGLHHIDVSGSEVYGTDGADEFAVTTLPSGAVLIHDFDMGQGDVLDLSAVLGHVDPVNAAIENFVFKTEVGGNTIISVDVNGTGDVNNAMQVAVLNNVTGIDLQQAIVTGQENL
jgi:T1SS-143 domain-containing protein